MQQKIYFGFSTDRVDEKNPSKRTPNKRITPEDLQNILDNRIYCNQSFDELPTLAAAWYIHGDATAKAKLLQAKKEMPWITVSGYCPIHHNDATLQYNGCVQVDIDLKTPDGQKKALEILQKIKSLQPIGVMFAGFSPATFGVKIIFTTTATEIGQHTEASKQAIKYLAGVLQIEEKYFDHLGASQPCFAPFKRFKCEPGQHYWRLDATKFDVCFLPAVANDQRPTFKNFEITGGDELSEMAAHIIANIKWSATHRSEFISVMICCKSLFDESTALSILEKCQQWEGSVTQKDWAKQWKSTKTSQSENGGILKRLANSDKYNNPFVSSKLKAIREWKEERAKQRQPDQRQQSAPHAQPATQPAPDLNNLQALPGEYLAGVLQRHGIGLKDILGKFIVSPTGSGKTTTVAAIVKQYPDKKLILVVPTIALVNRICERHPEAVRFVGGARKLEGSERFIVTCAQSFKALVGRVKNSKDWDVVFDEAHGFTSDTGRGYKLKALREFYAIAKDLAKSITYLTGTDLYNFHPDFLKLERLTIKAPQRVSKAVTLTNAGHVLATAVQSVRTSVESGRFPVLLLNDKDLKLAEVKHALKDLSLAELNSEKKEDEIFQLITKTGAIPAGVQAIVTTSVFKEGNDIHDTRAFDFIVVGAHHSSAIEQLSARARNAKEVQVQIIRHTDRKIQSRDFDPIKYADLVAKRAQSLCDEQNNLAPHDDTSALFFERNIRSALQYSPVHEDTSGSLQVDFFGVNHEVFQAETSHEYQNDTYLISNLQRYGFTVNTTIDTSELQHDECLQAGIKEARGRCKEDKKAAHLAAVETLQKSINPANEIRNAENAGRVPKAYKFAKDLEKDFGIPIRTAVDLLPEIDSPKKFALLKNQIAIDCLRSNTKYLQSGRIVALIILKMDQVFKDGMTSSATDLRRTLYQCLSLNRSMNLDFLSPDESDKQEVITANRKAVSILRMFFEVEHSGRESKRIRKRVHEFTLRLKHSFVDTIPADQKTNVDFEARVERSFLGSIIEAAPF